MIRRLPQRSGVVLLLALLLMAAIVGSTIAIGTAIANSTHQSKNLDDFLIASLAADSGLERGLAIIKTGRANGAGISFSTTAVQGMPSITQPVGGTGSATMTAVGAPASNTFSIPQLRPLESVTFDYLGFTATGELTNLPNIVLLTVKGDALNCRFMPNCRGELEIDWVALDSNAQPAFSGRTLPSMLTKAVLDGTPTQMATINLKSSTFITNQSGGQPTSTELNGIKGFRITVRALDPYPHDLNDAETIDQATIKNITITPPSIGANPTGVISLTSTGAAGTSQSIKQASVLWQPPASPFFSFVLFTEGNICLVGDPSCP